ncbi:hypothetical protein EC968_004482 [Mortierella alpina]|nr:hypothetical protein EC968_004482 [Mortierella alpina]
MTTGFNLTHGVHEKLLNFYLSSWYFEEPWDMMKVLLTAYDNAIKAILRLARQISVKSFEYDVVGVREYFTGVKYPRQRSSVLLERVKTRSKCCRSCQAFKARDKVGSESIALVVQLDDS